MPNRQPALYGSATSDLLRQPTGLPAKSRLVAETTMDRRVTERTLLARTVIFVGDVIAGALLGSITGVYAVRLFRLGDGAQRG